MNDKEPKLKPCPYCGSTHLRYEQYGGVCVVCNVCGTSGPTGADDKEAAQYWNNRRNPVKTEVNIKPLLQCGHCLSDNLMFQIFVTEQGDVKVQANCLDCGWRKFIPHQENLKRRTNSVSAKWRENVVKRDGAKCVICGSSEHLHVHHIIPVSHDPEGKYKYAEGNGITLCEKCHKLVHKI